MARSVPAL